MNNNKHKSLRAQALVEFALLLPILLVLILGAIDTDGDLAVPGGNAGGRGGDARLGAAAIDLLTLAGGAPGVGRGHGGQG